MSDKLNVDLPPVLSKAAWDKAKGKLAKVHPTGVGAALDKLAVADKAIKRDAFTLARSVEIDELNSNLRLVDGEINGSIKSTLEQALAVVKLATKARDDFRKGGPLTKGAMAAAAAVLDAAASFRDDLKREAQALRDAIQKALDQAVAEKRKAEEKEREKEKNKPVAQDPALAKLLKVVRARTLPCLRTVRANNPELPPPLFYAALGPTQAMVMLNKSVGASEKNMLAKILKGQGQEGTPKFFRGEVVWEAKAFTFVSDNPPSGAARKLQAALLALTKAKLKVRVRKTTGEVEEEGGGDELPQDADEGTAKAVLPKDGGAQAKALTTRMAAMKAALDKLVAQGDKVGAVALKLREAFKQAVTLRQNAEAWAVLDQLDDLLAMAAPASEDERSEGSGPETDDATPDGGPNQSVLPDTGPVEEEIRKALQDAGKLLAAMPGEDAAVKGVATLRQIEAGIRLALALPTPDKRLEALNKLLAGAKKLLEEAKALAVLVKGRADLAKALAPVKAKLGEAEAVINTVALALAKAELQKRLKAFRDEIAAAEKAPDPAAALAGAANWPAEAAQLKADADAAKTFSDWATARYDKDESAVLSWVRTVAPNAANTRVQGFFDGVRAEYERNVTAMKFNDAKTVTHPKLLQVYTLARLCNDKRREMDGRFYRMLLLIEALGDLATAALQNRYVALRTEYDSTWPAGTTITAMTAGVADFTRRFDELWADLEGARAADVGANSDAKKAQIEKSLATFKKTADALKDPGKKSGAQASHADLAKDLADALKLTDAKARGAALVALEKDLKLRLKELQKVALHEELATPGGKAAIDKRIADMGGSSSDPDDLALCEAALEVRFNIKVRTPEDLKKKGLPRMYDLMCKVPEWQANQKDTAQGKKALNDLEYGTESVGDSNYYSPSRKVVSINVNESVTEKYIPDDASRETVVTKTFDVTTLHEVGHSVDEKIGFMKNRMDDPAFGGWRSESVDSVVKALAEDSGFVGRGSGGGKKAQAADLKALVRQCLLTKTATRPANASAPMGSLFDEWDAIVADEIIVKCKLGMNLASKVWWGGKATSEKLAVGGRCYHEAYAGDWVSYDQGARGPTGVNFYQWRAPAEWFAEIYAMYYMGTLSASHPLYSWFETAAKTEEEAAKKPAAKSGGGGGGSGGGSKKSSKR